jgi:hypothetical protein
LPPQASPRRGSVRIRHVDEAVLEAKARGEVGARRLHVEALGGVVARRHEGHARFARKVRVLLADLAGDVGVDAELDGLLEQTLRATGAPGDALDAALGLANHQWRALERAPGGRGKLRERARRLDASDANQALLPGAPGLRDSQAQGELRVVAELGMRVERQVKGKQIQRALEREGNAPSPRFMCAVAASALPRA